MMRRRVVIRRGRNHPLEIMGRLDEKAELEGIFLESGL